MSAAIFLLAILVTASSGLEWKSIEEALTDSMKNDVPVLFMITKSKCKPCKKLTAELESSEELSELSTKFALARAVDDLPKDPKFNLDGKYVPKIVFLNGHGIVLEDIVNADAKSEKAKYFYKKAEHVLKSMQKALEISNLDSGFGKAYVWYKWEDGIKAAETQNKPIMAVFHQDWCGACQRLKPKFAESSKIKELASEFIMINTDAEEIVKGDKYKADGEYYPKILFLDSDAEYITKEWNHGTKHSHVLHYYGDEQEIAASMKRVIANNTLLRADDNGYGTHIKWVKYEEGLNLAKEQGKPAMLLIHKSYCGACKALKPKFQADKEIAELSRKFVMINTMDDDEPTDDQYDQDGAYIPRIFFIDNLGKVETSIFNPVKDYKKAKYAYGTPSSITDSMKKALEMKLGERKADEATPSSESTEPINEQKASNQPSPSDGFGTDIKWYSYEEGLREAKKSHKIVMLVFYNDYCQFSAYMKEQFRDSPSVIEKSQKFVMINVEEEESKKLGDKFDIDGTYTPRIFFMDPDQNIHKDLNNTDTPYKSTMFYYGTADDITKAMDRALESINLTLGRGFGEYIQWVKYEKALEVAKETNMPVMMIIHKSWCGACSALKPKITQSRAIWKLSYYFVMTNVEDSEEPLDNQYFIDGGYYPRIYFLDSEGKVHHDQHNRDPAFLKYKYSYSNEEQIEQSMKFAIAKLSPYALPKDEEQVATSIQDTSAQGAIAQDTSTPDANAQATDTSDNTASSQSNEGKKLSPSKKILAESGVTWNTIEEALELAKTSEKPIMFLIHRTTCPACKAVLKTISRADDFKQRVAPFILADIEDDVHEAQADSYDVDGGYVPRIYFLTPDGKIFKDAWNKGTNYLENKFYYYEMNGLYKSMEKVLNLMESWKAGVDPSELKEKKDEL